MEQAVALDDREREERGLVPIRQLQPPVERLLDRLEAQVELRAAGALLELEAGSPAHDERGVGRVAADLTGTRRARPGQRVELRVERQREAVLGLVDRADDDRLVRVALHEVDQHLVADLRKGQRPPASTAPQAT